MWNIKKKHPKIIVVVTIKDKNQNNALTPFNSYAPAVKHFRHKYYETITQNVMDFRSQYPILVGYFKNIKRERKKSSLKAIHFYKKLKIVLSLLICLFVNLHFLTTSSCDRLK